jgi:hypothetical protein
MSRKQQYQIRQNQIINDYQMGFISYDDYCRLIKTNTDILVQGKEIIK